MQQDRNYRYAPTYSGGANGSRRSVPAMEHRPACNDGCGNGDGCGDGCCENVGMGCGGGSEPMVLAMAYVMSQPFEKLYSAGDAMKKGTLFMGLDLPYGGTR